jgi:hypothetical protein
MVALNVKISADDVLKITQYLPSRFFCPTFPLPCAVYCICFYAALSYSTFRPVCPAGNTESNERLTVGRKALFFAW